MGVVTILQAKGTARAKALRCQVCPRSEERPVWPGPCGHCECWVVGLVRGKDPGEFGFRLKS